MACAPQAWREYKAKRRQKAAARQKAMGHCASHQLQEAVASWQTYLLCRSAKKRATASALQHYDMAVLSRMLPRSAPHFLCLPSWDNIPSSFGYLYRQSHPGRPIRCAALPKGKQQQALCSTATLHCQAVHVPGLPGCSVPNCLCLASRQ